MHQFFAVFSLAGLSVANAEPCRAGGDWPDGPNKPWFDGLQRPDNQKNPSRDRSEVLVLLWDSRHR